VAIDVVGPQGWPDSAVRLPASVATPASQFSDDVVPETPASQAFDPVLRRMLEANGDGMRKRRADLGLSPDIQVAQPAPKKRLLSARLNISSLLKFV
jgi:hypothetical protein